MISLRVYCLLVGVGYVEKGSILFLYNKVFGIGIRRDIQSIYRK